MTRKATQLPQLCALAVDLHLVKPVDPHDLLRVVDELWRVTNGACPAGAVGG